MPEKRTIEDALTYILTRVRSDTSEAFFPSMALCLAEALQADYTEIGELLGDRRTVRTLSLVSHGKIIDNITYDLTDTPCDNVVAKTICSYPSGTAGLFPRDILLQQMGVEGYVGVPLFDSQQRPIGIMVAFYRSPLTDPSLAETILQLFAMRVASEIERRRTDEILQKNEEKYRTLIDKVQVAIVVHGPDARVVACNPMAEELLGLTEVQLMGRSAADPNWHFFFEDGTAIPPDKYPVNLVLSTNQSLRNQVAGVHHPGREHDVWVLVNAEPIWNRDGGLAQVIVSFVDITERKRTESKLLSIMKAVESTSDAIGISDARGRHFFQNKALSDLFGYTSAEELEAAGGGPAVVKDPAVAREMFEQITSGRSWAGELEMVTKNGRVFPAYERADAIKDSDGNLVGLIGIITDITERKRADDALHLFKDLVEHSSDAIGMSTPEGKHYFQNEAFNRMFGKIGDYPPEDVYVDKAIGEQVFSTILGGGSWKGEVKMFRSDRTILDILLRAYAIKNKNGRILGLVGLHTDITERKKIEESLLKLSQAVEQSPVSIVITDTQGNIEFVNPRFTQVTGYRLDEVLGRNPRVLQSGETPRETYTALWETITAGKVWEGDFLNKKKNGQLFWECAAISPIRDSDGNISHYLGIKEDTTERKKLEEQLRQAQKMEALGQLAGGVAHDFNNILSTISGYASLLEMTVASDATLREYISEITVASERGANLTKSLLAFSRKQDAALATVNLNDQIRSSHKVLSRLIGEDIDLVLDLSPYEIVVEADTGQLQQVLMNLASNARDAMPGGGSLRISTKMAVIGDDHRDRYSLDRPGRYALVSLADTGVGMEPSVREHVFEPFYTTKGVGKGTGLGLSIVFGMVQKHRGSIVVDSEPGKGTVFNIYLPLSEKGISGPALSDRAHSRGGGQTILLVEDEEPVRRVIRLILESFGYTIIEAVDGEDAVQVFRENRDRVQLVLCDLVMPKKNGRDAYEEMRKIRPDIKAIFMSGYTKDIFDKKGISDSEITLLLKPLNPLDLVDKISEALQQSPPP